MKMRIRTTVVRTLLAASLSFAAGYAYADDFSEAGILFKATFSPSVTLPAGETRIRGVEYSTTMIGENKLENRGRCSADTVDGTVIKPYPASYSAVSTDICFGLMVTNGNVTLDLTEIGDTVFTMQGGIWVGGNGSLTVKGRDCLNFGSRIEPAPRVAAGWRCAAVTFVDAEGTPYESPAGVVFTNMFMDVLVPANVPWTVSDNAVAMLYKSTGGVVSRYVEDGTFTLDKFDVCLLGPEAVNGVDFHVNPGRTLKIFPMSLCNEETTMFNFNGTSSAFPNNVELGGAGAVFSTCNHYSTTHTGAISGTGSFRFEPPYKSSGAYAATVMRGPVTFSGDIVAECSADNPFSKIVFEQASLGAAGNSLRIGAGVTVELKPSTVGTGTVASIEGPETATLFLRDGVTLTVTGTIGAVILKGDGWRRSKIVKSNLEEGEVFRAVASNVGISYEGPMSGVRKILASNGTGCYYRQKSGSQTIDFDLFDLSGIASELTVAVQDGDILKNVPDMVRVVVPASANVQVFPRYKAAPMLDVAEGGRVSVGQNAFDYANAASFWLDANKSDSYTQYQYKGVPEHNDGRVLVDAWHDCRGEREDVMMRSDKFNHEVVAGLSASSIMPIVVSGGLNGLDYMALTPNHRRISVFSRAYSDYCEQNSESWDVSAGEFNLKPRFCIMVFGSQAGGGCALLADDGDNHFVRGGDGAAVDKENVTKDNPIFKKDIPVWVDGVRVDATRTGLSGGWQVISFPTAGKTIVGLGHGGTSHSVDYHVAGNANYAEVMFFDRELSDTEREHVERYLSDKWGLAYNGPAASPLKVNASGKGTIVLNGDAELAPGNFEGKIDLGGNSLLVGADPLPPTSSVVTYGASPLRWFDPELTNNAHMTLGDSVAGGYGRRLEELFDVVNGNTDGERCLAGVGRSPTLTRQSRGNGPVRNWIDFSPFYGNNDKKASGCCLRFKTVPYASSDYSVSPLSARTVLMAQDSSKGGGTPFMDAVMGSTLMPRLGKYDVTGDAADCGVPIWRNSSAVFAGGATYLDGLAVDGAVSGFNGRPEVLTAVGCTNFSLSVFGDCLYLEGHQPNDIDAGEVIGEVVIYGDVLSDVQRKAVEAYLSWKWCGNAINGYACHTNLSIEGSGTVKIGSLEQMPKLAPGFAGTADMSAISELDFVVHPETGAVDGALSMSSSVALPSAVTAKITFSPKMRKGVFTLVEAAGGLDQTNWTLEIVGDASGSGRVRLDVSPTKVSIEVPRRGLVMTAR